MLEPKVLVADEPVSALDVSIRSQVLNLMKRLQAEHGMASVVISHDLAVVKYLSDRIGVMYLGKLVELGTGDDIYHRAAHPYTEALIKTIPVPDPRGGAHEGGRRDSRRAPEPDRSRRPAAVSVPAARTRRTRAPRSSPSCDRSAPDHVAACHFPLQTPSVNGAGPSAATGNGVVAADGAVGS